MSNESGSNGRVTLGQSRLAGTMQEIERRFELSDAYVQRDSLGFVTVPRKDAVPLITHMRDYLGFTHLVLVTAVDVVERGILRLLYLLHNYGLRADIGIQVEIPRGENPVAVSRSEGANGRKNGQAEARPGHDGDTLFAPGLASTAGAPKPAYTEMESIHHLWAQAATYQRELKEMYGVHFPGSPRIDDEFALEGWKDIPPMRRDFDTLAYSERTFFPRPGRESHDPVEYMKQNMYPDEPTPPSA